MEEDEEQQQGAPTEQQLWDKRTNYDVELEPIETEEELQEMKPEPGDVPVSFSHEGSKDKFVSWNPHERDDTLSEPDPAAEGRQHQPPARPTGQAAAFRGAHLAGHSGEPLISSQLTRGALEPTGQEKQHICTVCSETFPDEKVLANHLIIHTTKALFKCSSCGLGFKTSDVLKAHSNVHRSRVACSHPGCSRVFLSKSLLERHMKVHTGERPYQCNTCGKQFRRMDTLKIHFKVHPAEKPYSCSYCENSFDSKIDLNDHMLNHTGDMPCQCNTCGKQFRGVDKLNVHVRRHIGEKSYSCEFCGKCFANRSALNIHGRMHTENFLPPALILKPT